MYTAQRLRTPNRIAAIAGWVPLLLTGVCVASSDLRADPPSRTSANNAPMEAPTEAPTAPKTPPMETTSRANNQVPEDVTSVQVLDECLVGQTCIDRFLWVLYQRAPKLDQIEVYERREVAITKRGRMVTVSQRVAKPADSDFAWKDPKAATKAGISLMDYVVGGMDRSFKSKLFYMLKAAEQEGFSPGITSGFRDDYRQAIASGLKAKSNMSYHGGSFHGGYGHGLAADVISIKGKDRSERLDASRLLWDWIDQHGKQFGIGRPYLSRDPPHAAPTDGKEYAHHRGGERSRQVAGIRKRNRIAAHDRGLGRRSRAIRPSKA